MSATLRTFVLSQVACTALLWTAAHAQPGLGIAIALPCLLIHVSLGLPWRRELVAVAAFALAGTFCESTLAALGFVRFPSGGPLCPSWVVFFWASLGSLANGPLSSLGRRPLLAGVLGALVAPLSFLGSEAAGVLTLTRPLPATLAAVGVAVGLTLAVLLSQLAKTTEPRV
jgi:hypothetical protein